MGGPSAVACSYSRPHEPSSPTTNYSNRDGCHVITTTRSSSCSRFWSWPAAFCQTSGCRCWKTFRLHVESELLYGWRTCQSNMAQSRHPPIWNFFCYLFTWYYLLNFGLLLNAAGMGFTHSTVFWTKTKTLRLNINSWFRWMCSTNTGDKEFVPVYGSIYSRTVIFWWLGNTILRVCVCVFIQRTKLNVAKTFKHCDKVIHKECKYM